MGSDIADFYDDTDTELARLAKFTSEEIVNRLKTSSGEKIPFNQYLLYKDRRNRAVVYICQEDVSEVFHQVAGSNEVSQYLSTLEAAVGKEIDPRNITPPQIPISDFELSLVEREAQNSHRRSGIHLEGEWRSNYQGAIQALIVNRDIGTLTYEGRLVR